MVGPDSSLTERALEAPAAEKKLLRFLTVDSEHKPLILKSLKDEFLTDPRVRKIVEALRGVPEGLEPIDFQGQIAHLTDDERTFLSGIALDEIPEPTEKSVVALLKALETSHLKGETSALQQALKRAEEEKSDVAGLVREIERRERRIAELNRKG